MNSALNGFILMGNVAVLKLLRHTKAKIVKYY